MSRHYSRTTLDTVRADFGHASSSNDRTSAAKGIIEPHRRIACGFGIPRQEAPRSPHCWRATPTSGSAMTHSKSRS